MEMPLVKWFAWTHVRVTGVRLGSSYVGNNAMHEFETKLNTPLTYRIQSLHLCYHGNCSLLLLPLKMTIQWHLCLVDRGVSLELGIVWMGIPCTYFKKVYEWNLHTLLLCMIRRLSWSINYIKNTVLNVKAWSKLCCMTWGNFHTYACM